MKKHGIGFLVYLLAVGLLAIAGCGPRPPTPTPPQPIATPTPTSTSEEIARLTATASPSVSPEPSETPTPTPCPPPEGWVPYVVEQGDNLYRLALPYGLTAEEIQEANCLPTADEIQAGQRIYIPWYITPTPTLPPSPTPCFVRGDWVPYTVQPSDNLYRIAVRYGLSVWDIQSGNCLESDLIWDDQILYVPYLIPTSELRPTSPGAEVAQPPIPIPPPPGGEQRCVEELGVEFCYEFECDDAPWQEYTFTKEGVSASCADNQLRITVEASGPGAVWDTGWTLNDVRIYAEIDGPQTGEYGVLCRYQDEGTHYAFLVNKDGQYTIRKRVNGQRQDLVSGSLPGTIDEAFPLRLRVTCQASELTLSVNDIETQIDFVDSKPLSGGRVGLVVEGSDERSIEVRFERVLAERPE